MVTVIASSEVLKRGLVLVGFSPQRQMTVRPAKNMERFKAHYGASPGVYASIWTEMQITHLQEAKIDAATTCLENILMAAHFLKCYPTENQAEAIFNVSDRTYRDRVNIHLRKLQALKAVKIVWPRHWNPRATDGEEETTFIITVDGIHCRIQEPMHGRYSKNPKFYSHKFKQAGLAYEVAVSIFEDRCVWINGPFPAGKNDLSIFRAGLKDRMAGKLGVGDKGYRGESDLISLPNSQDSEEVREFKSRALARHEKFNGQIKNFACMSEKFHHGGLGQQTFEKHQMCFEAVAVICQYQLENGSPMMVV